MNIIEKTELKEKFEDLIEDVRNDFLFYSDSWRSLKNIRVDLITMVKIVDKLLEDK